LSPRAIATDLWPAARTELTDADRKAADALFLRWVLPRRND
jgi:hypothetical protein